MVPVLGADIVMGTARKSIFVNTRPKPHVSVLIHVMDNG